MQNIFSINMHAKCSHEVATVSENHHHHDKDSQHHHACTPFCACGIVHFILQAPPYQALMASTHSSIHQSIIFDTTTWATNEALYQKLMVNEIWHPPQQV